MTFPFLWRYPRVLSVAKVVWRMQYSLVSSTPSALRCVLSVRYLSDRTRCATLPPPPQFESLLAYLRPFPPTPPRELAGLLARCSMTARGSLPGLNPAPPPLAQTRARRPSNRQTQSHYSLWVMPRSIRFRTAALWVFGVQSADFASKPHSVTSKLQLPYISASASDFYDDWLLAVARPYRRLISKPCCI